MLKSDRIDKLLVQFLGNSAIHPANCFQVDPITRKLVKALYYLEFQYRTSGRFCDRDRTEAEEIISDVLKQLYEILGDD